jgi:hypothetical protein
MVSDTGSFRDRARDAVPYGLVVPDETVVGVESSQRVKLKRDLTLSGSGMPHRRVGAMGSVVVLPLNMELNLRTTLIHSAEKLASPSVSR